MDFDEFNSNDDNEGDVSRDERHATNPKPKEKVDPVNSVIVIGDDDGGDATQRRVAARGLAKMRQPTEMLFSPESSFDVLRDPLSRWMAETAEPTALHCEMIQQLVTQWVLDCNLVDAAACLSTLATIAATQPRWRTTFETIASSAELLVLALYDCKLKYY